MSKNKTLINWTSSVYNETLVIELHFTLWAFDHTFAATLKKELIYRQLTALVFVAAFLAQTYSRTFIIADYYTNTGKYAKDCINKARPKMHCNGKCQMMKKLQEQEKKDQENQERKQENKNEILLSSKSFFATVPVLHLMENISIKIFSASSGKSIDRSFDIFHPPQA